MTLKTPCKRPMKLALTHADARFVKSASVMDTPFQRFKSPPYRRFRHHLYSGKTLLRFGLKELRYGTWTRGAPIKLGSSTDRGEAEATRRGLGFWLVLSAAKTRSHTTADKAQLLSIAA